MSDSHYSTLPQGPSNNLSTYPQLAPLAAHTILLSPSPDNNAMPSMSNRATGGYSPINGEDTQLHQLPGSPSPQAPSSTSISPDGGPLKTDGLAATMFDKYGKPIRLGHATLFAATAAMTNTILGAGMLGLPHAMAESGYILGFVLLVAAGCASGFALHLLSVSAKTVGIFPSSFFVTATKAVGKWSFLIDLAVAIKCFGVATSYLIVIGDLMPEAITTILGPNSYAFIYDRRTWILLFMGCFVLPLSCLRSLNALRFTSTISIFFVGFLSVLITFYALLPSLDECAGMAAEVCKGPTELAQLNRGTLKILSIFIFGFTCHQNIFSACNEVSNFTIPRINKLIHGCIGIAFTCYALIAVMAYHTYGSAVQSNILKNYPDNYTLAIARILISMNVAFTFPLQCNPCRMSISLLFYQWKHRHEESSQMEVHHPSEMRLSILTTIICLGALGISLVVTDLGVMLSIVGATGSTTISYILPGLIFLKLHPGGWTTKHYFAAGLFGVGCLVIPSCLTFIFI